jgi:hypothetical protein
MLKALLGKFLTLTQLSQPFFTHIRSKQFWVKNASSCPLSSAIRHLALPITAQSLFE